ncbi:hypothetical protein ACHAW6_013017 [Cyclotella cf. meneghiniana]
MSFAPTMAKTASSSAQTVLQRRAIQCSFSSVFHIRNANGGKMTKESEMVERIFIKAVAWPLGFMFLLGGSAFVKRELIEQR